MIPSPDAAVGSHLYSRCRAISVIPRLIRYSHELALRAQTALAIDASFARNYDEIALERSFRQLPTADAAIFPSPLDISDRHQLHHPPAEAGVLRRPSHGIDILVGQAGLLGQPAIGIGADMDAAVLHVVQKLVPLHDLPGLVTA